MACDIASKNTPSLSLACPLSHLLQRPQALQPQLLGAGALADGAQEDAAGGLGAALARLVPGGRERGGRGSWVHARWVAVVVGR